MGWGYEREKIRNDKFEVLRGRIWTADLPVAELMLRPLDHVFDELAINIKNCKQYLASLTKFMDFDCLNSFQVQVKEEVPDPDPEALIKAEIESGDLKNDLQVKSWCSRLSALLKCPNCF